VLTADPLCQRVSRQLHCPPEKRIYRHKSIDTMRKTRACVGIENNNQGKIGLIVA
jgi:hypothetical protein